MNELDYGLLSRHHRHFAAVTHALMAAMHAVFVTETIC